MFQQRRVQAFLLALAIFTPWRDVCAAEQLARVAIAPFGGDANPGVRDQATALLRTFILRQGVYQPVHGDTIRVAATTMPSPPDFETPPEALTKFAADTDAEIVIWGDVIQKDKTVVVRAHVFDLLQPDPMPRSIERELSKAFDMRTVCAQIIGMLPDDRVIDPVADNFPANVPPDAAWLAQPNLLINGTFDPPTGATNEWIMLAPADDSPVRVGDLGVDPDRMAIIRERSTDGQPGASVLTMSVGGGNANALGMACFSSQAKVEPGKRYRVALKYRSAGPSMRVSIRGFRKLGDTPGYRYEQEVYRHGSPVATKSADWMTIAEEFTIPTGLAIDYVRVELNAVDATGIISFDDVELKAITATTK